MPMTWTSSLRVSFASCSQASRAFHLWRGPGEIAKLCTLCAFGRSEKDTEELFAVQRAFLLVGRDARRDQQQLVQPQVFQGEPRRLHVAQMDGRQSSIC